MSVGQNDIMNRRSFGSDISLLLRNIFLGETFSSYISVHNDSSQVVKDILVKVRVTRPALLPL